MTHPPYSTPDVPERPRRHLHVFPIPEGYTLEQAWAEITTMGRLVELVHVGKREWATVQCDGVECESVEHS